MTITGGHLSNEKYATRRADEFKDPIANDFEELTEIVVHSHEFHMRNTTPRYSGSCPLIIACELDPFPVDPRGESEWQKKARGVRRAGRPAVHERINMVFASLE
ncbi:hypothetical protein CEXT_621211 [Caerostris extrusa]|uniref:Uncharacterized protein n=1 Tax=Caerostris extrusa TaxID=172846 RepID=A0AAV4WK69_CAEEX|nr:hypothetical protein CEXT_621211 [Caerostris extrusa]